MVRNTDGGRIDAMTCGVALTGRHAQPCSHCGFRQLHSIMWGKGRQDEFPVPQSSGARIVAKRRQNIAPGFSPED